MWYKIQKLVQEGYTVAFMPGWTIGNVVIDLEKNGIYSRIEISKECLDTYAGDMGLLISDKLTKMSKHLEENKNV